MGVLWWGLDTDKTRIWCLVVGSGFNDSIIIYFRTYVSKKRGEK